MTNSKGGDPIEKDIRILDTQFEIRELEDSKREVISGYALKFDRPSENLGGWLTEYLERGCLDKTDMSNVVALLNHDSNYVLGRTGVNLSLDVDDVGLYFELEPSDTSYSRDLLENMRSGLINKCSFAFTVTEDGSEWEEREGGGYVRYVKEIDRLYDVSVVTTPAYEDTEAMLSQRTKDAMNREMEKPKLARQREIEVMEMEQELL